MSKIFFYCALKNVYGPKSIALKNPYQIFSSTFQILSNSFKQAQYVSCVEPNSNKPLKSPSFPLLYFPFKSMRIVFVRKPFSHFFGGFITPQGDRLSCTFMGGTKGDQSQSDRIKFMKYRSQFAETLAAQLFRSWPRRVDEKK